MLDADVPDPENQSFTTYLHWVEPNIALSASTSGSLPDLTHTKYIPPHPQRGTPYHRYCLFLLPHKDPNAKISLPPTTDEARRGFDLRQFCEKHGIEAGKGGAAQMWREVWDETVSDIYKHTLSACLSFPLPRSFSLTISAINRTIRAQIWHPSASRPIRGYQGAQETRTVTRLSFVTIRSTLQMSPSLLAPNTQ